MRDLGDRKGVGHTKLITSDRSLPPIAFFAASFLVFFFACFARAADLQGTQTAQLISRVWRFSNGLPQDAIQALVQTKDGFLWIGTKAGLVRFDGFSFTIFNRQNTPEFLDPSVLTLYSRDGVTLWIGTEGGGLLQYRQGRFVRFGSAEGLTNGFVRALFENSSDELWVGTDHGLFRLSQRRFLRVDLNRNVRSINVYSISEDASGRMLIGCTDDADRMGVLAFSDKGQLLKVFTVPLVVGDPRVRVLHRDRSGGLWVGAGRALWHWSASYAGDIFAPQGRVPLRRSPAGVPTVNAVVEGPDGESWIGTSNAGVLKFSGGNFERYLSSELISDTNVLALLLDEHGAIWVGTANGLTRLRAGAARVFGSPQGAPISVRSVYQRPEGRLFAISSGDRLYRITKDGLERACLRGVPCDVAIRTFFEDDMHKVWVGTAGQGLFAVQPAGVQHYPDMDLVRAFAEAPDRTMWVGLDSGLTQVGDHILEHINGEAGLGSDSVRALGFDHVGGLWVGTDQGVVCIRDGHVAPFPVLAKLSGEKVYGLLEDQQQDLLFATRGGGLWILRGSKLLHLGTANGLPSDSLLSLLIDDKGSLWVSSDAGIFSARLEDVIKAATLGGQVPVRLLGTSDGVPAAQMNGEIQPSAWKASNGSLWFSTTAGAVRVDPWRLSAPSPFPTLIEEIISGTSHINIPSDVPLKLAPSQSNFEIRYTAINLENPELVRFRYRLKDFDKDWVDAGVRRTGFYTNVPPGKYTFQVEAYDSDQTTPVSSASLRLERQPAWFQAWWFYFLCGLAMLLIVAAIYWLHLRTIQKRFAAVLDERTRVAREMHDTLIQGCVGVSTLLEAAASTFESAPVTSKGVLNQARYQIHATVEDARLSVWNIRHRDSYKDFVPAIKELVHQFGRPVPQIQLELEIDSLMLPEHLTEELSAMLREALVNALQHANASVVTVHLAASIRSVTISIADDGRGFDTDLEPQMHYGLIGIRERVGSVGGELSLTSAHGEGTCVSITIPTEKGMQRRNA